MRCVAGGYIVRLPLGSTRTKGFEFPVASEDQIIAKMAANQQLHDDGKLSYEALCVLNEALQAQIESNCAHRKTEKEDRGDGDYIVWCASDNCGVMVEKHIKDKAKAASTGAVGKATKQSGGMDCAVVGVLLLGVTSAAGWGAVELIRTVLGS